MMPNHVQCPNCFDGVHSACTGPGCYCDCQLEGYPESIMGTVEDAGEREEEDNFRENGYA